MKELPTHLYSSACLRLVYGIGDGTISFFYRYIWGWIRKRMCLFHLDLLKFNHEESTTSSAERPRERRTRESNAIQHSTESSTHHYCASHATIFTQFFARISTESCARCAHVFFTRDSFKFNHFHTTFTKCIFFICGCSWCEWVSS